MMAMSFKRDLDSTSMAEEEQEEEQEEEVEPGLERASNAFRTSTLNGDQSLLESNDDGEGSGKMPLHSGLSALIQAATTQLGQLDEDEQDNATAGFFSSNSGDENGGNSASFGNAGLFRSTTNTPHRYTPHGFHTTITSTITTSPNDASVPLRAPSLLTTPPLGPEATAAPASADVRKLTFPEILMTVLEENGNEDVITFLPDGKFFALRRKEFSETTMVNYFSVDSFGEFLEKIHSWGFSRIVDQRGGCSTSKNGFSDGQKQQPYRSGIEIFRHPMFVKGDWEKCSRICFGESPTDVRLSALPDRARIEYTLSDESTLTTSKRRLSPSHTRQESLTSLSKQRLSTSDNFSPPLPTAGASSIHSSGDILKQQIPAVAKSDSADTTSTDASAVSTSTQLNENTANSITTIDGIHKHLRDNHNKETMMATTKTSRFNSVISKTDDDDVRSLALAITTEKLNLKTPDDEDQDGTSTPLIERAVENATHTIVTDAIETLLRDEGHSRQTYLKHERELSRSSLPGVIPISTQLFSARKEPSLFQNKTLLSRLQPQGGNGVTAAEVEAVAALTSSKLTMECDGGQPRLEEEVRLKHDPEDQASSKVSAADTSASTTTMDEGTSIPESQSGEDENQPPKGPSPLKEEGDEGVALVTTTNST